MNFTNKMKSADKKSSKLLKCLNFCPFYIDKREYKQKGDDVNRLASMGSRLTLQGSHPDAVRVLPAKTTAATIAEQRAQVVGISPLGLPTKKKHGRTLAAQNIQRENSLQKQLTSNLIFQRQQQRLLAAAAAVDDHTEVPDSYPAIRVPNETTTSAGAPVNTGTPVTTATLPRRSASNAMTFSDLDPQILSRSGNRSRRNSSASSAPAMGQQPKRSSSCRLGRSCSKHSLCRSQIFPDVDDDDTTPAISVDAKWRSKKDLTNGKQSKKNERTVSMAETTSRDTRNNSSMSVVIYGDSNAGLSSQWRSSVALTGPPQERLSDVSDEFGFQRGIRTPDFVYMRIHPSCSRKYIIPVENSGKTRLLDMKHILKQETLGADYGIFQNSSNQYYAFVRVCPPLDETFVVTSGDDCKEVAVFNGKTWEVVRTLRWEEK